MISDPFLRQLIEQAIRGGNDSIEADLDPAMPWMRRMRPMQNPGMGGPTSQGEPQGPVMPQGFSPGPEMPRQNLAQRLGPLMMPQGPMYKQKPGRMFLRGLVSGFNGRAGGGAGGAGGAGPRTDPNNDLRRALLQAQIESTGALKGSRDARTSEINEPDDNFDPFEDEKRAWWEARVKAANAGAGAADALAERRRRPDPVKTGGGGRGGSGGGGGGKITYAAERTTINARAAAEAKRREAAVITHGAAANPPWTKEQMQAGVARMRSAVQHEHAQLLEDLDRRYGVTHNRPTPMGGGSGVGTPSTLDILNGK